MRSVPGAEARLVAWVVADAAGKRRQPCSAGHTHPRQCVRASYQCCPAFPLSEQGRGGAWIVHLGALDGDRADQRTPYPVCWWYQPWSAAELDESSTWLESINATESIAAAVAGGAVDVIVVLDSLSWVSAGQKLSRHLAGHCLDRQGSGVPWLAGGGPTTVHQLELHYGHWVQSVQGCVCCSKKGF